MASTNVTLEDCTIFVFPYKHKKGIRVTHYDSGATGVSVQHGSEHKNKMEAFKKMRNTQEFRLWMKAQQEAKNEQV